MHTIAATRKLASEFSAGLFTPRYFETVEAGAKKLEKRAWKHLVACHARLEEECFFDTQFVDTAEVRHTVTGICNAYGRPEALHGVLASLYLYHRHRFLRWYQDYYFYDDEYCFACPDSEESADVVSAYGYFGRSAPKGDIVDFADIAPSQIEFSWHCPADELWEQLKADQQLPLRVIKYDEVRKLVNRAIREVLRSDDSLLNHAQAVQNLSKWLLELELSASPLPAIAVAAHTILLQAI